LNGEEGSEDELCDPVNPKPDVPGLLNQFVLELSPLFGVTPAEKLKFPNGAAAAPDPVDGVSAEPNSSGSWNLAEPSAFAPPI
jgi:hypothetical protein